MEGWIYLHRSLKENWVWNDKPFSRGQAWIDILFSANYKENKFPLGDEVVIVERGSFITSELKLMERWGWSKTKVRTFLNQLQNDGMIIKKSDRKKTTLTVCNYDTYQVLENQKRTNEEPLKDQSETDERPKKDTTNKSNKGNKRKESNKESSRFTPPTIDEVSSYCKERNNSIDAEGFIDFYEANGWMVGKNKMKDWKATIRNWERRNKSQSTSRPSIVDEAL